MRKSLILISALLVFSLGGLLCAHAVIGSAAHQVTFTETTLAGDPACAEGLTARFVTSSDYQLFWDHTISLGKDTSSVFSFDPENDSHYRPRGPYPEPAISFYVSRGGSYSGSNLTLPAYGFDVYNPVLMELASQMPSDSVLEKTILLRDYNISPVIAELHYPLYMDFSVLIDNNDLYPGAVPNTDLLDLMEKFPIGCPENASVQIRMEKDEAGALQLIDVVSNDNLDVYSLSLGAPDCLYFIVIGQEVLPDGSVKQLDYSQVPGGFGLYRLPFQYDESNLDIFSPDCSFKLKTDELEMIYPLSDEDFPQQLYFSKDQKDFFLVIHTPDGNSKITVFDTASGKKKQEFSCESGLYSAFTLTDNCTVFCNSEYFSLLERNHDGTYHIRFSGEFPQTGADYQNTAWMGEETLFMDFDGEKLAVMQAPGRYHLAVPWDISISIFDESGLIYCGTYESTIKRAGPSAGRTSLRAVSDKNTGIHWD